MIYSRPGTDSPVDQGDIIHNCPILTIREFDVANPGVPRVVCEVKPVVVLTQACDLANRKVSQVNVCVIWSAEEIVAAGRLKGVDVRGPIRAARIFGWYFLPKDEQVGMVESIVDLRHIHTLSLDVLSALCQAGHRRARIQPLFREHLGKHFGDTFSRIGLPAPYETE